VVVTPTIRFNLCHDWSRMEGTEDEHISLLWIYHTYEHISLHGQEMNIFPYTWDEHISIFPCGDMRWTYFPALNSSNMQDSETSHAPCLWQDILLQVHKSFDTSVAPTSPPPRILRDPEFTAFGDFSIPNKCKIIVLMRTSLPWIQITLLNLISKVQLLAHALDNWIYRWSHSYVIILMHLRVVCYLMIWSYIGMKERTSKGMGKTLEAWRTSEDVRIKMEAQTGSTSF
jgi:hypothetical protein